MKIHNKLIKSKTVTEKTDLWGNFITTILTRMGLHTNKATCWYTTKEEMSQKASTLEDISGPAFCSYGEFCQVFKKSSSCL